MIVNVATVIGYVVIIAICCIIVALVFGNIVGYFAELKERSKLAPVLGQLKNIQRWFTPEFPQMVFLAEFLQKEIEEAYYHSTDMIRQIARDKFDLYKDKPEKLNNGRRN